MRRSLALTFVSCAQAIASQNSSAHSRTLLRLGSSDLLLDISVSAGSYPSDVFWELSCSINGRFRGAALTGGATFEGSLQSSVGASCSLSMSDSFGDGWNGAEWTGEAGGSSYGPFSVGNGATASATFDLLPHSPSLPLSPPLLPTPSPFRPPPPPFRPPPSPFRPPPPPFLPLESSLHGDIYRHILRAPDSHHRNLTVCLYGIWYIMGWYGMVWYGTVWHGKVLYGMARYGV